MRFAIEQLDRFIHYFSIDPGLLTSPHIMIRLVIQGCLLVGSAFFSGSETALFSLSDVHLEQLRRKRHPKSV